MTLRNIATCTALFCAAAPWASAQQPTSTPPVADPARSTPAPKVGATDYRFVVLQVAGDVKRADMDVEPATDVGWTAIKEGDILGPGTQIKTGMRSKIKIVMEPAEPPSIIMFSGSGLYSVDELLKAQDPQGDTAVVTRLGVAYGEIRAGVAEGSLRSDLQIRSPVATLAKKGTWDFGFFAERGTGNFRISLADRGLVLATQNSTGKSLAIQRGQFVNQLMGRWIDTVRFNRPINVQDWYGLKGTELVFNLTNQSGLGVLAPGGDLTSVLRLSGRQDQIDFGNLIRAQLEGIGQQGGAGLGGLQGLQGNTLLFDAFGPRRRNEGNFGVGLGVLPVLIDPSNPMVQRGSALPGRIDIYKTDARAFLGKIHR